MARFRWWTLLTVLCGVAMRLSADAADVTVVSGLEYATYTDATGAIQPLLLDLYLPVGATGPLPVVVHIHGGGWRTGSRADINTAVTNLVSRGYAVASIDYRLSGVARWPAQIQDCKKAVRWLRANAATFGLDAGHLAAWGSSAGGHLAAMLGVTGNATNVIVGSASVDLLDGGGNLDQSSAVQAVVDWFGPTDVLRMDNYFSDIDHDRADSPESELIGAPIQTVPEVASTANPALFASRDSPPFLIMHGTADVTVPFNQSELLHEALVAAGASSVFQPITGARHADAEFSTTNVAETVYAFLDEHLRGIPNAGQPTVNFFLSATNGPAPLAVLGNAAASTDTNGTINSFDWSFGDNTGSNGVVRSHTYTVPGTYPVTIAVGDTQFAVVSRSRTVVVTANPAATNDAFAVAITGPVESANFAAPASFMIEATASAGTGRVEKVEFYVDGALLGADLVAPYNIALANLVAGTYTLTARAISDDGAALFSTPVTITVGGTGLLGEYFAGTDFTTQLVTRVDSAVEFDWGAGSPAPELNADGFAVRWSGQIVPRFTETYTFSATTDDGVRVWVNGELLISKWNNQSSTTHTGTIALVAGVAYDIVMEYFENTGNATARLQWSSASQPEEVVPVTALYSAATGLAGEYFEGTNLTTQRLARVDAPVDFAWGTGGPDPRIGTNSFSARWTGQVIPRFNETYAFTTVSDDGVRLWVNGVALVDNWTNHAATTNAGAIALLAGQRYDITMEYYQNTGSAVAKLLWSSASEPLAVIPATQLSPQPRGLRAEYFEGTNLITQRVSRADASVNFGWGPGGPDPLVGTNHFSARWTGQVIPRYSETYAFSTISDDGVRLWVNGVNLVSNWTNHAATTNTGAIALLAGQRYEITMEYYENTGSGVAKLLWASPSQIREPIPPTQLSVVPRGLRADYFAGTNLATQHLTRVDGTVDFMWGPGGPDPRVGTNSFSVRWTGQVIPQHSADYTFATVSDDGVRLWVNGVALVDNWTNHGATTNTGTLTLLAGQRYDITMEYYENTGNAVAKLLWSSPGKSFAPIPATQLFPAAATPFVALSLPAEPDPTTTPFTPAPRPQAGALTAKDSRRTTSFRYQVGHQNPAEHGSSSPAIVATICDCLDLTGRWNITITGDDVREFAGDLVPADELGCVYTITTDDGEMAGNLVWLPTGELVGWVFDEPVRGGAGDGGRRFELDGESVEVRGEFDKPETAE